MVIKADSPAGFAEQYIVESIWNGVFSPGTMLPAERELSEMIGVTRTTLREVLQRLSRDGWLTIKHGKATQVNNFWETSSLNVLATLAKLEQVDMPTLVQQVLKAKNQISHIYWSDAIKLAPEKVAELLSEYTKIDTIGVEATGKAWANFDHELQKQVIALAQNPMYLLIQNGFDGIYKQIAPYLFGIEQGKIYIKQCYERLHQASEAKDSDNTQGIFDDYNHNLLALWCEMKGTMALSN